MSPSCNGPFLIAVAVDARAATTVAIADPIAVGGAIDDAMEGGDFVRFEAQIADRGPGRWSSRPDRGALGLRSKFPAIGTRRADSR